VRRGKFDAAGVESAFEVIERNARLQTRLIEDLLDVSRIISGSLHVERRPITAAPAVEAAVASARPLADAKGVRLDLARSGGRVEVRVEPRGPEVQIVVRVALHDGSITAESPGPGEGATFTVSLPSLADVAVLEHCGARRGPRPHVRRRPRRRGARHRRAAHDVGNGRRRHRTRLGSGSPPS